MAYTSTFNVSMGRVSYTSAKTYAHSLAPQFALRLLRIGIEIISMGNFALRLLSELV